jgi:Polysaccharide lyase
MATNISVNVPASTVSVSDTTLLGQMPTADVVAYLQSKGYTVTSGTPTPTPTPTPPAGAILIQHFSDIKQGGFVPQWQSPFVGKAGKMVEISTPYGPGFDNYCSDTDLCIWDSTMKTIMMQVCNVDTTKTETWEFYANLPTQKLVTSWNVGGFWECGHTDVSSGNLIAIDNSTGTPTWRLVRQSGPGQIYAFYNGGPVQFNHWTHFVQKVKWSRNTDGFLQFSIDGNMVINYNGATLFDAGTPQVHIGWYGDLGAGTNHVQIGGVNVVRQ